MRNARPSRGKDSVGEARVGEAAAKFSAALDATGPTGPNARATLRILEGMVRRDIRDGGGAECTKYLTQVVAGLLRTGGTSMAERGRGILSHLAGRVPVERFLRALADSATGAGPAAQVMALGIVEGAFDDAPPADAVARIMPCIQKALTSTDTAAKYRAARLCATLYLCDSLPLATLPPEALGTVQGCLAQRGHTVDLTSVLG